MPATQANEQQNFRATAVQIMRVAGYVTKSGSTENFVTHNTAIENWSLWQAKHDKSGMSSKSSIEFQ